MNFFSGLLGAHNIQDATVEPSTTTSNYEAIGEGSPSIAPSPPTRSRTQTLLLRLGLLLIFVGILVVGVVVREFVHVQPPNSNWTDLCIPEKDTKFDGDLNTNRYFIVEEPTINNGSLSFCNVNYTGPVHYLMVP